MALVLATLAPFRSYSFDDSAALEYSWIRHALEISGKVIGPYDLQIAAICRQHGCTLVTTNTGEFSRVDGLVCENWL